MPKLYHYTLDPYSRRLRLSLAEYETLQDLYSRLRRLDVPANNSTPIRTGIRMLADLDDATLARAIRATPSIPRGPRPSREGRSTEK